LIDWSKLGPAGAPLPETPDTTAPVAPAQPGAIPTITPLPSNAPYETGHGFHPATQAQVDAMNPGERMARGIDFLGDKLFGQGNGSPLGGIPLLGDLLGSAGNAIHGVGDLAVVKPIEVGSNVLSHIPIGWLPGGTDDTFNKLGDWAKANDPAVYHQWQAVNAAANGDILGGANLKADFSAETAQYIDDQSKESKLGTTPALQYVPGSVGGFLSHAVEGFLGLAGNTSQRALGGAGFFDPQGHERIQQGGSSLNRVEESGARLDAGEEVSDVEKKAVEAYRSGAWSLDHAQDYIVSHGQGITRNAAGQIIGSVFTDPLTAASLGAGSIAKAGEVGVRLAEAGAQASTTYEKLAATVAAVQQSQLGPAFRLARGLVDPLAVVKLRPAEQATTDLLNATALKAFDRAYGPAVGELRAIARETGLTREMDSAIASYSVDQAYLMVARKAQRDMLVEGVGEELVHSNVDDVIQPLAQNAARDAETELTDHMMRLAKNTFTAEEEASLAGRLSVTFGKDVPYWQARMTTMSHDLKSAFHATTYKRAEVEFEQARAAIDRATYAGELPLDNMVLMTSDTLDDVRASAIIENIRDVLKSDTDEGKIAMATREWNAQARRFPAMENIGYATGGREQVEMLVKELEKKLKGGGLSRRALDEELNDPGLRPIRDMLDRHSVPGEDLSATVAPEDAAAFDAATKQYEEDLARYETEKAAYDDAAAAADEASASGEPDQAVADVAKKWRDRETKNRVQMEKDIHKLEEQGYDTHDAEDALGDYEGIDRADYEGGADGREEYNDARQSAWDDILDRIEEIPPLEKELPEEPIEPVPPDAPEATIAGRKRLWNVGFRPDEEVAWGLKRDANTGRYVVDRDPTISHVVDAVPGRQPFSDTTRNVLGQIIGKSKAERLNGPIDSIEAMTNTMRDVVTGRRLVGNIEKRFERSTFDAGIPKPMSKEIFAKAREVAGLDYSTVRGMKPDNLWNAIHEIVPRDLVLKDGSTLNVHIVMDHLLKAAEGDLRIMGVTSVLSQRMRNQLRKMGDGANWSGQMTVTMYNKLRYSQPMFLIQRITDAPYYSILYGVTPVGKKALTGANAELRVIEENLGRTGLGRDFSMDLPEYATRSNFTSGIKSAMQQAGLKDNRLQRILEAPDTIIANNMTNMLHARLGEIVKGTLDNLTTAGEKADPAFQAEMLAAGETLQRSFADWRRVYSEQAGRVLDDNEVGLKYIQDQLNGWRRHIVNSDGTIDMQQLIHEGERAMPSNIADIGPIRPDRVAQELGYADAAALRRDVTGHIEKINGEFVLVKGEHDIPWLEEQARTTLSAHPDYTRRLTAYFGETWDDFWTRLSRGVDEGGLDISPHYAKEAQDLIAIWARDRGMDPWEYLSGVMASNIGARDLETHMGQLMGFLKSGKAKQPLEEWTKIFRASLDPSAQAKLIQEFEAANNVEDLLSTRPGPAAWTEKAAKSAPGKPARTTADLPKNFKPEPGYAYRIDVLDKMRGGWRKGEGVAVGAPDATYIDGRAGLGVFRAKAADGADLGPFTLKGKSMSAGNYRQTKRPIAPENIEMLTDDGWVSLGEDPMTKIMAKDFPEAVRQRIISGTPHPDPEIEGYMQALSKWVQDSLGDELGSRTRADLRRLVEAVPTTHATTFNRSQALVVTLLKDKISDAQTDIFRLAEMQTQRSVLERGLNHPLFALYPASYMWGKVLPETVKFLAKNPYAATYVIADVQRAIATQREYDRNMDDSVSAIDRSAGAFLLDYLTPSLPWSDHSARMSPMVRDLLKGKDLGPHLGRRVVHRQPAAVGQAGHQQHQRNPRRHRQLSPQPDSQMLGCAEGSCRLSLSDCPECTAADHRPNQGVGAGSHPLG
jgi:hypothetical protein